MNLISMVKFIQKKQQLKWENQTTIKLKLKKLPSLLLYKIFTLDTTAAIINQSIDRKLATALIID